MILPWAAKHSSISPPPLSNSSSVPEYDRVRNSRFQVTIPVAGSPTSPATLISSVRQVHGSPSPSVSSPPLRAPTGRLEKSRLAVPIRRRPDRNCGKGREKPNA